MTTRLMHYSTAGLTESNLFLGIAAPPRDDESLSARDSSPWKVLFEQGEASLEVRTSDDSAPWFWSAARSMLEFLTLPENWDSYDAAPTSPQALVAALELLETLARPNTPRPDVVPTVRGGIQLEWHTERIDLEIEIVSPGRIQVSYENYHRDERWAEELSSDFRPLANVILELSGVPA